jgi:hypothetical protein
MQIVGLEIEDFSWSLMHEDQTASFPTHDDALYSNNGTQYDIIRSGVEIPLVAPPEQMEVITWGVSHHELLRNIPWFRFQENMTAMS